MDQKDDTVKRKKWQHINERERTNIELLCKEGYKAKDIAEDLGRHIRTIARKLKKEQCLKRF